MIRVSDGMGTGSVCFASLFDVHHRRRLRRLHELETSAPFRVHVFHSTSGHCRWIVLLHLGGKELELNGQVKPQSSPTTTHNVKNDNNSFCAVEIFYSPVAVPDSMASLPASTSNSSSISRN